METVVGRITVVARIENMGDLWNVKKGFIKQEEVHRLEVADALVDTGSTRLSMPLRLIKQLGFDESFGQQQAQTTNGMVSRAIYGPARLTVQGRFCTVDIAELPDDCPVLIGQVPLELLDFVADPKGQCLIGNPRHGGQQMFELY